MNLTGKTAIVTGSGRGIGREIALRLAGAGASIVVNDVNHEMADSVEAEIAGMGVNSKVVIADVSSGADVSKMVESVIADFGKIDILVNNAGINRDQIVARMSEEDWDNVLRIDLKSVFLCSKAVLRSMLKQRWGRIINMSSIVGIAGNSGQANYSSAKAGIIGFTRTLAKEVGSRYITVNAVAPGFIDTEMTQKLPQQWKAELIKRIPAGYFGSTRDVAEVVAFLASEEARYVTGQVLSVDGGIAGAWM